MSGRIERLFAVLVVLMALLVVAQTTTVPGNSGLSLIGLTFGSLAIVYALIELLGAISEPNR